jgi:hypothetical protein
MTSRTFALICRRSASTTAERWPCFSGAARARARPSAVRAPVDFPPCIRQRPLPIAGPRQGRPARVRAPQRRADVGSPGGFPFFNQPYRGVWGALSDSGSSTALCPPASAAAFHLASNHRLTAITDMNMLNHHGLPTTVTQAVHGNHAALTDIHHARTGIH